MNLTTSPQRVELGRKRALLTRSREVAHEKWLAHVAYLIQSYYRQYFSEMQRNPDTAGRVIESFVSTFESDQERHRNQMAGIENQIEVVTQQIENLAARGL